ncbi:H-2 class I histocompatibility antigen, Q9 alpha chain-like [Trichomycterus rosablanca]|uniref:H-2 class I histocompatibility antigen, Q9 alpha chain-like n=1 Tax=Trichomycterus rosablanca TaxID=2290929 RepID=UPI002F35A215
MDAFIMRVLLLLSCGFAAVSAGTHSLQYFYTGARGINFPEFTIVGMMDGGQFVYYDSNMKKMIPKTEWIKKNEGPDYWKMETDKQQGTEESFKVGVTTLMERFNQTEGVHVVQWMYGCERDDDGTVRGYDQHGYDGEDFISLDLKTGTWTAANAKAVHTKHKWESAGVANYKKNYLEKTCIEWLEKYVSYGRETLERKDRPEASVFHKHFPQPELVCHATGFFPRDLVMSWQKNGEEMHEDVEITTTAPNQDGTFQKRAALRVSPEELKEHEYTCVVQHSSLEKDLVLKAPGSVDVDVGGGSLGIIVGAVVAVLALVALIAGVWFWKKKNSGFKPVPAKPNSSCKMDYEHLGSDSTMSSTSSNDSDAPLMKKK